ncbi:ABC transporter substrate-binding protein [Chloroflexota bacterium]
MIKKIIWLVVSSLMALSLVMAACGPAEVEEEVEEEIEGELEEEKLADDIGPKYGGTINLITSRNPSSWDPTKSQAIRVSHMQYTSNELMQGDWSKGPQGTGETEWEYGFLGDVGLLTGELAESWELPDDETIIYNLVKGAKYHDKPPANGREVTAEDVVWNIEMQFNYPTAWQTIAYPPDEAAEVTGKLLPGDARRPTSVKAIDRYTVEVKVPASSQGIMLLEIGENLYTSPPEIWDGDGPGEGEGMDDWTKVMGSGPFTITDFVPDSSMTYSKFPDYYETDPLYPGNKWPYADHIRILIIPDTSTRQAALRVGTIDMLTATPEDGKVLLAQIPELQWSTRVRTTQVAGGRLDKPDLPYQDLRVRRALNLAVDQEALLRDLYDGEGMLLAYPYPATKSWEKYFTPLEEMPKVQELFSYDPEKAKELLAEAGYPEGFKTVIQCTST